MRKLENFFESNLLNKEDKLLIFGGQAAIGSKTFCGETTCVDNCADTQYTWTRDDEYGNVISVKTEISMSSNDCP
jgi:hypothetical protein